MEKINPRRVWTRTTFRWKHPVKNRFMKIFFVSIILIAFSTVIFGQSEREKGIELFRLGEYTNAIEVLEKLYTSSEADYPTAVYLGASYVKTGKKDRAIEVFLTANAFGAPKYPIIDERKIKINKKPAAKFSKSVKLMERSGRVRLAVELKHDGKVGFIFPFSTTSEKLLGGGIDAAMAIRFDPAIKNGKLVSAVLIFEYSFQIR